MAEQKNLSFKIDVELHERLLVVAERDQVSVSYWVREALRWALDEDANPSRLETVKPAHHTPLAVRQAMPRRLPGGRGIALPNGREIAGQRFN